MSTLTRRHIAWLLLPLLLLALLTAACGSNDAPASSSDPSTESSAADTQTATRSFVAEADKRLDEVVVAADQAAAVLTNADVGSPAWRADASAALHTLATTLDDATALDAPDHMSSQYDALVSATTRYRDAALLLAAGIDTVDLNIIEAAAGELADATLALAVARAELIG